MAKNRDKYTMINEIVSMASEIMEAKVREHEIIIELRLEKYGENDETVTKLREHNKKTSEAIAHMREWGGCWA